VATPSVISISADIDDASIAKYFLFSIASEIFISDYIFRIFIFSFEGFVPFRSENFVGKRKNLF
jgi:hypothetical protein